MEEEAKFEMPELIPLDYAAQADLSCGGCRVSPVDDEEFVD